MFTKNDASIMTIDVDNQQSGLRLCLASRHRVVKGTQFFVSKTPKGYHFYFCLRCSSQELNYKRRLKVLTNLGFEVDFLTTGWSTVSGPGYELITYTSGEDNDSILSPMMLPDYLLPVLISNKSPSPFQDVPDFSIPEGSRNERAFNWFAYARHTLYTQEVLAQAIDLWCQSFCNPPLDTLDAHRIWSNYVSQRPEVLEFTKQNSLVIAKEEGAPLSPYQTLPENARKKIQDALSHGENTFLMDHKLHPGFLFWCRFNGFCWNPVSSEYIRAYYINWFRSDGAILKIKNSPSDYISCRNLLWHEIEALYSVKPIPVTPDRCLPFNNGYLEVNSFLLQKVEREFFLIYGVDKTYPTSWNAETFPSPDVMEKLAGLVRDQFSFALVRSMFYRSLVREPELQTGYLLQGEPASGKGVLVSLIQAMLGDVVVKSSSLDDLHKSFDKQGLTYLNVLILNEIGELSQRNIEIIASLLGRDPQSFAIKYKMGSTSFTFKGIIIISSNTPPEILFANAPQLIDRFEYIETIRRVAQVDHSLQDYFRINLNSLIYWFLSFPKFYLPSFARTGSKNAVLKSKTIDLPRFCEDWLVYDTSSFVLPSELLDEYQLFSEKVDSPVKGSNICKLVSDYFKFVLKRPDVNNKWRTIQSNEGF